MDICGSKGCTVTVCQASVPLWKGLIYVVKILSAKDCDSVLKMDFALSKCTHFQFSFTKRMVCFTLNLHIQNHAKN